MRPQLGGVSHTSLHGPPLVGAWEQQLLQALRPDLDVWPSYFENDAAIQTQAFLGNGLSLKTRWVR